MCGCSPRIAGLTAYTNADIGTDTMAGFADFTYDFTDQLSLSLGGRYTWDKRTGCILRQNYLGGGSPVFGGLGTAFGAPGTNFRGTRDLHQVHPQGNAELQAEPGLDALRQLFARASRAAGSIRAAPGVNAPDTRRRPGPVRRRNRRFPQLPPEKVNSYEVGYKASLFDRRVYRRARRVLHGLYRCPDPRLGRLRHRRVAQLLRRRLQRRQGADAGLRA